MAATKVYVLLFFCFVTVTLRADLMDSFEEEKKVNLPPKEKGFLPKDQNNTTGQEPTEDGTDGRVGQSVHNKSPDHKKESATKSKTDVGSGDHKKEPKTGNENKKLPVHFKSSGLTGAKGQGVLELHKDVVVTQGDLQLESDEGKVLLDKDTNEVKKVFADGKVRIVKKDEASGKLIKANGDSAEFDNEKQLITLKGDAKILKGDDLITGNLIFYNLKTGWIKVEKVKGVVNP